MKYSDLIKYSIFAYSIFLLVVSTLLGASIDSNILKWMSVGTSLLIFIWFSYERWIWKWPLFNKISHYYFGVPVLHGTWKGILEFESDQNGEKGSVDIYVSINQTLTAIHICSFFTKPSESNSIATSIYKDYKNRPQLYYLYKSEAPHGKRDTNRPHDGAVILNIIGSPVRELSGSYFTDRKGAGQIKLQYYNRKASETLEEAIQLCESNQTSETPE